DTSIQLDGVLIAQMGRVGTEMTVGAKNDPGWAPVELGGLGGVTAEILKDGKLFAPDIDQAAVHAGGLQPKQAALLMGYRGSPALDVAALAGLIVQVGRIMAGNPAIRQIDLNPVIVYPEGQGVIALDALMLVAN